MSSTSKAAPAPPPSDEAPATPPSSEAPATPPSSEAPATPRPVWIDTDTAIGVDGADVDDGLALIQAFHSPELSVRGVSAVFGNAPLDACLPIAAEVVERFGPDGCPVHGGAASATECGEENDAVRALAEALRREPLDVLALGPVTNVASLIRRHPELAPRMRSVVAVAARRPDQRFFSVETQKAPFPDFNFECDAEAMRTLLESGVELVFAPWEVSSHVWLEPEDLDRLEARSESGAYIARHSRGWLEIWQREMGAPGFNPFDTLAVAWLTHPAWLEHFDAGVWIEPATAESAQRESGGDAMKPQLLVDAERRGRRATYCWRPSPRFKPMLLERLAAPAPSR